MSTLAWVLVGAVSWLAVVVLVVLLVRGGAEADRVQAPRVRVQERRTR